MVSRYIEGVSSSCVFTLIRVSEYPTGHLSDPELVAFLKRARTALRPSDPESSSSRSVMVVKENVCEDLPNNQPQSILDEEDSSLTR